MKGYREEVKRQRVEKIKRRSRKVKKLVAGFLSAALVLLLVSFAGASVKVVGTADYYTPNYGEINDVLADTNTELGTAFAFKEGMAYGFGLEFGSDAVPNLGIRLEYSSFASKTEDSYSWTMPWGSVTYYWDTTLGFELVTTPIILSAVYQFSPASSFRPYLGLGVGTFSSKLSVKQTDVVYQDDEFFDTSSDSESWNDSPIGYQGLAGAEIGLSENLSLIGEVRYISAKATFEGGSLPQPVDCDWSEFTGRIGLAYKF